MRLLLEILVIAFLIFLGWRQPLRDQVRTRFPQAEIMPSRLAMRAMEAEYEAANATKPGGAPGAPPRSNDQWMWQPGTLDAKPKKGQ